MKGFNRWDGNIVQKKLLHRKSDDEHRHLKSQKKLIKHQSEYPTFIRDFQRSPSSGSVFSEMRLMATLRDAKLLEAGILGDLPLAPFLAADDAAIAGGVFLSAWFNAGGAEWLLFPMEALSISGLQPMSGASTSWASLTVSSFWRMFLILSNRLSFVSLTKSLHL